MLVWACSATCLEDGVADRWPKLSLTRLKRSHVEEHTPERQAQPAAQRQLGLEEAFAVAPVGQAGEGCRWRQLLSWNSSSLRAVMSCTSMPTARVGAPRPSRSQTRPGRGPHR